MHYLQIKRIAELLIGPDLEIFKKRWRKIVIDWALGGVFISFFCLVTIGFMRQNNWSGGITEHMVKPDMFYNWYYPFTILLEAMREELLFRLLPLAGAVWGTYLIVKYAFKMDPEVAVLSVGIAVAIPMSAYFGYTHGDWRNIFIQGFGGLVFSFIFLKYGGLERRIAAPFVAATLCHAGYNLVLFTPYVAAHFLS